MMHTILDADGVTVLDQWDDGEPDWQPPVDPIEVFSAKLRSDLPAATTIAKMRTALTEALDELDAARSS